MIETSNPIKLKDLKPGMLVLCVDNGNPNSISYEGKPLIVDSVCRTFVTAKYVYLT